MPTVAMNVPERKAPSLNWSRKQVFPTPESPSNITCKMGAGRGVSGKGRRQHLWVALCPPRSLVSLRFFPQGWSCQGWGAPCEPGVDGTPEGAAEQPPATKEGKSRRGELVGRQVLQQEEMAPGCFPTQEPSWGTGCSSQTRGATSAPSPGVPSPRADAWLGQTLLYPGLSPCRCPEPCLLQTPKQTQCLFPSC